ncbi:MAG: hypothetical protein AAFQ79_13255 [Pseudomonadota bacterium]
MTKPALFGGAALLIAGVALVGFGGMSTGGDVTADDVSEARQEAAENAGTVITERETTGDETLPAVMAGDTSAVELETTAREDTRETMAALPAFTVDGYDAQRVSYLLQQSDMPVELRNDYLAQLRQADDDPDTLRAVLRQLRDDLAS